MAGRNAYRPAYILLIIALAVIVTTLILSGFSTTVTAFSPAETPTRLVVTQPPPKVYMQSVTSILTKSLGGPLTVIVTLKGDFRFDVKLSPAEEMNRTIAIKMAQVRLIANLAPFNVEILDIADGFPDMALKIDTLALIYLLLSPDVATITENFSLFPSDLPRSTPPTYLTPKMIAV